MTVAGAGAAAVAIAEDVRARRVSTRAVVAAALERIAERDPALNCFTHVRRDAALAEADGIDRQLAGVPFAVKNLFDVAGIVTLAGSRIIAARLEADGVVAAPVAPARG